MECSALLSSAQLRPYIHKGLKHLVALRQEFAVTIRSEEEFDLTYVSWAFSFLRWKIGTRTQLSILLTRSYHEMRTVDAVLPAILRMLVTAQRQACFPYDFDHFSFHNVMHGGSAVVNVWKTSQEEARSDGHAASADSLWGSNGSKQRSTKHIHMAAAV